MKSLFDWMVVIFMFMYWGFRLVVEYMFATGREFFVKPINETAEIIILFITLFCIFMVIKREHLGGIIYFITYGLYFGADVINTIKTMAAGGTMDEATKTMGYSNIFFSFIAIVLAFVVMIDLLADHVKTSDDRKTSWFYENKDLDRKLDDREDKNQYRLG